MQGISVYSVDDRDRVVALSDLPPCDAGAPLPAVIATEDQTFLAYHISNVPDDWDGANPRCCSSSTEVLVATVTFNLSLAHFFGPPNDEVFDGHPLSGRGVRPYGIYMIENSSWLRTLERMNSAHPRHRPENFRDYKHYIFSFHDSTFECVAKSYEFDVTKASLACALATSITQIRQ